MPIPQVPSPLTSILAAKMYNAAWFPGATIEAQINNAIAAAATDGALYVFVPANMLPYNASLVVFNSAVRMLREGGPWHIIDVKAYGANTDGVTNNIPAFVAAIAGLPVAGGPVYASGGDYFLTSTLNLTFAATGKKKISLTGDGIGITRLISSVTTTPAINVGGTANDLHHSIEDLDVLQSGLVLPSSARAGNYGIVKQDGGVSGSPGSIFRNIRVRYFGDVGIRIEGGHGPISLENIEVQACSAYGIHLVPVSATCQDVAITGSNVQFCWGGVHLQGAKSTDIQDLDIELTSTAQLPAIRLSGSATGNNFVNVTASVEAVPTPAAIIYIDSGQGNQFLGGLFVTTVAGVDMIFLDTSNASYNTFIGGFWESVTPSGGYYATLNNGSRNTFITPRMETFTAGKNVVNDANGGNICIGVGTVALASDYGISIPSGAIRQGVTTLAAFAAGNNNDYALPVDFATFRVQGDAGGTSTLTGIVAGPAGRRIRLVNVSAFNITLTNNDAASTAANQLRSPSGASVVLGGNDVADLEYDASTQRWRICSVLT